MNKKHLCDECKEYKKIEEDKVDGRYICEDCLKNKVIERFGEKNVR